MNLVARALKISFKDAAGQNFDALDIDELTIGSGAAVVVTGPSGSGKSTLLHALAGLTDHLKGTVAWSDSDLLRLSNEGRAAWRRTNLGFVFQDFHLIPELSPVDNVVLPYSFNRYRIPAEARQRASMLLDKFEVPRSRRLTSQLSRGEQQRVSLARALIFDPPVILADEPTASLDEASAARIISDLFGLARQSGKTVIVASHDPRLIAEAGECIALAHGRMERGCR